MVEVKLLSSILEIVSIMKEFQGICYQMDVQEFAKREMGQMLFLNMGLRITL